MLSFKEYNEIINSTLICVDIQPEYQNSFSFNLYEFITFINRCRKKVIFLFNGPDLGFPTQQEYQYWLMENGLTARRLQSCVFYDKGYAFFRYCIDSYIDEDAIVDIVRFMLEKHVHESRELDEEFWNEFVQRYHHTEVRELLQFSDDLIHIPDLMTFLQNYNNVTLCGGGVNECLKEVEIALKALNKNFNILQRFTY